MSTTKGPRRIELNIAMDLVRVTEAAAIAGARFMGMGDKESIDQSAVDAMRLTLDSVSMDGVVVIGEGEKDEAPMLYIGERVGAGSPPQVDIAVDPIDGTTLLSKGLPGAISAIALSGRGTMNVPEHVVYVNKIAVGADARDAIDINAPVDVNIKNVADAKGRKAETMTVVVLDRPRHEQLVASVRAAGARIRLITDGDVAAGIQAALPGSGVDMLMGIGGVSEGVLAASAIRSLGGEIQCKAWPRDSKERTAAETAGVDVEKVYCAEELVGGEDVYFAATGASSGDLLKGVKLTTDGASTQSLVMCNRSGTVRWIDSFCNLAGSRQGIYRSSG